MHRTNAWAAQTRWLTDQTYVSPNPGIWTDKITRRDRASGMTESELKRHRKGLADGYGHLPPRTKQEAAIVVVERALNALPARVRNGVTARMKWDLVEKVQNNR